MSDAPDVRTVKKAERTVTETEDRVQIPLRIAFYRRRAGLSQSELAGRLRIHPGTLSRLENGRQYLTEMMEQRIAYELDLSSDERNHMLGLPLGAGTGAAGRAPQPGSDSSKRLWLVGAPVPDELEPTA